MHLYEQVTTALWKLLSWAWAAIASSGLATRWHPCLCFSLWKIHSLFWGLSFYLHTPCNTQNYLEKALESQVGRHDLNGSPHLTNTRINKSQLWFSMVPSNTHLPEQKWRFCKQLCFCVLLFLSASAIGA